MSEPGVRTGARASLTRGDEPAASGSLSAHLFERDDHDRADGRWLEPFDFDTAAEHDAWWHADYRTPEDW